ncbi:MAG: PEP/pyruvate-binding domain-containing protein [Kofleriaceae bacterium]
MRSALVIHWLAVLAACGSNNNTQDGGNQVTEGACQIADASSPPDDLETITCKQDFDDLASLPIDTTLPSATSMKVVLDTYDANHLYYTNTQKYPIHYNFCSAHLSGTNGLPTVGDLASFNSVQYFSPDRRFILGAVTYYALPDVWVLELSPYDTASKEMIETLFYKVKADAYFGPKLAFHPTSEALTAVAATLPSDIPVVTTDDIYNGIDYQPLSLATAVGTLHFTTAASLSAGEYVSPYTIVVLDSAPNDLSVVQGTITQDFQTPLSHINVLAHTRKIPNMGLRNALTNPDLLALKDQLAMLTTTAEGWTIAPISDADAQAYWAAHAPAPVTLPVADLSQKELRSISLVTPDPTGSETLLGNLQDSMKSYGGKAAHYSVLYNTPGMPIRNAFGIPIYYYNEFMTQNGFYTRLQTLLADPDFTSNATTREAALTQLRTDMIAAPLPADLVTALDAKVQSAEFSSVTKMKFRSSSNSEDISGFPCAGCYDSFAGKTTDEADMQTAVRQTYASVFAFRAFELRTYYGVAHDSVGMAILAHENFPDEAANGVAVTANPFDASGLDPAYYINVQLGGDVEVVSPPPGVSSDQFLYYFTQPNQPISFIAHSSLTSPGVNVLTTAQTYELGTALQLIHNRFSDAYGPGAGNNGWYAMDVEFKFDNEDDPQNAPHCYIKQARPYADPSGGAAQ